MVSKENKIGYFENLQLERTEKLQRVFSYLHWRHRIPIGDNLFTPGTRMHGEWEAVGLPSGLSGKSFLDAGANDGMYCFIAENKGAKKIVASDIYARPDGHWNHQNGWNAEGIESLKALLNSKVQIESCSVYDIDQIDGKFDYIFFSNVFYWLQDPLLAMEKLAAKCNQTLHIREDISHLSGGPLLEYRHEFNSSKPSGYYWGNKAFFEKTFKDLGFNKIHFLPIDELKLFEERLVNFPKVSYRSGSTCFSNPFDETKRSIENPGNGTVSSFINNRYFIQGIGWFEGNELEHTGHIFKPENLNSFRNNLKYQLRAIRSKIPGQNIYRNYSIIAER